MCDRFSAFGIATCPIGLLYFLWLRLKSKAVLTLACLSIDQELEQALASKKVIAKQMFDRLSAYGIVSRYMGSLRSLKLRSNAKKVLILERLFIIPETELKSKAVLTLVRLPIDHEAELAIASAKLIAELMCDCLAARGIAS
ncbi:hypothetical protein M0802_016662 [Mischocyttarus mexicanus]|nr:hypothetical protein M0802_016662 [Mischocyttarus mexicanus]